MTNMINEIVGFENIHVHTSIGSHLDGHGNPEEYAERARAILADVDDEEYDDESDDDNGGY